MKKAYRVSSFVFAGLLLISLNGCKSIKDIKWKAKDDTVSYTYAYTDEKVDAVTSTISVPEGIYIDNSTDESFLPGEFALYSPDSKLLMTDSLKPSMKWTVSKDASSYIVVIQKYDTQKEKFTDFARYDGIKKNEYTIKNSLEAGEYYRWCVIAENPYGRKYSTGIFDGHYEVFLSKINPLVHPANTGRNFSFDGAISKEVLCNYISRAITISSETDYLNPDSRSSINRLRNLLYTGAKYASRAASAWVQSADEMATMPQQKKFIDLAHSYDRDIIFEACIFENVTSAVGKIKIPAYVFKAFGLSTENRCFNYNALVNPANGGPDITKKEAQMYIYYRACAYIDAGYEALHMGQIDVIAGNEYNVWTATTKVYNMIRSYASQNARRHFVLLNAHTSFDGYHNDKTYVGTDGKLLFDFFCFPLRATTDENEDHVPSVSRPQTQFLKVGNLDAIYNRAEGGLTHSGWTCESLPYYVEFDNAGGITGTANRPTPGQMINWGRDDISWFASQPANYRSYWLNYSYNWVLQLKESGYVCMPGLRPAWSHGKDTMSMYDASPSFFSEDGTSDVFTIRNVWVADNSN